MLAAIRRAESWVTVSSTWLAKNMVAVSMIANSNAKNTGATNANSIAADPRRLRRKQRNALLMGTLDATGDDIEETPGRQQHSAGAGLPETDC